MVKDRMDFEVRHKVGGEDCLRILEGRSKLQCYELFCNQRLDRIGLVHTPLLRELKVFK